ncbi:hypothetical protein V6Z12_A03G105000 [Gossypium hirsutum]
MFKSSIERQNTTVIIYEDDNILTKDRKEEINNLKKLLAAKLEIKDLRQLRYFLGMELARSRKDISKGTGRLECKPANSYEAYQQDGNPLVDKRIKYLNLECMVNQFVNSPTEKHLENMYCIPQYLKEKDQLRVIALSYGNLTTWLSKKKFVVARSSSEVEFRAMSHGIERMLEKLKISKGNSVKIFCDNKTAITIAKKKNPYHHDQTKHVEIDSHFIKEMIEEEIIRLIYTPTFQQPAQILTKALLKIFWRILSPR